MPVRAPHVPESAPEPPPPSMDPSSSASATEANNLYVERLDALLEKQVADIATFAAREGRPADEVASVP